MTQPAGIVMIGGLSLELVATSVKMNMMKLRMTTGPPESPEWGSGS
jgi:hypothetical protein